MDQSSKSINKLLEGSSVRQSQKHRQQKQEKTNGIILNYKALYCKGITQQRGKQKNERKHLKLCNTHDL